MYLKKILILLFILGTLLYGDNFFLKNHNIVDIGHNANSNVIEVPKEEIYTDPQVQKVPNVIDYTQRKQSPLIDCETDFLGTETCQAEQNICPGFKEYDDGYSTPHNVTKKLQKICPYGTLKIGDKCYADINGDGQKDSFPKYSQADKTTTNYYWCNGGRDYVQQGTGWDNYGGCGGDINWAVHYSTVKYSCSGVPSQTDTCLTYTCPSGYLADGEYCYKKSKCPANTTLQSDNTCQMNYTWYSYSCPAAVNSYSNKWNIINPGSDCGDASCVNSATPPHNNCVRLNYTCPIDPNMKCGKTINKIHTCPNGYIWNNNRCERVEKYCGKYSYDPLTDSCHDITYYAKKCKNSIEKYNPNTDLCESDVVACQKGVYDRELNECVMKFVPICKSGYVYNYATNACENNQKKPCESQYDYSATDHACIGRMTVCKSGFSWNATTKKCETTVCDIVKASDVNNRCEKSIACVGVITSDGFCIPDKVQ